MITLKDSGIAIGNISVNRIEKKHNYCNVGMLFVMTIGAMAMLVKP